MRPRLAAVLAPDRWFDLANWPLLLRRSSGGRIRDTSLAMSTSRLPQGGQAAPGQKVGGAGAPAPGARGRTGP
eukprot:6852319-Pyramimonas_sp.AAC.1